MLNKKFIASIYASDKLIAKNLRKKDEELTESDRRSYFASELEWGRGSFERFDFSELPRRNDSHRLFLFTLSAKNESIIRNIGWIETADNLSDEGCLDFVQRELNPGDEIFEEFEVELA